MQPLSQTCTCSQVQIDLSCTNDYLSQASQSSIEHVLVESSDDLIAKENDESSKMLKSSKRFVCVEGEEQSATFSK
jgi:cob(I)alamin adenosyltransferase